MDLTHLLKKKLMKSFLPATKRLYLLVVLLVCCSTIANAQTIRGKRAISSADMKLIESYEADYSSRVYRDQQIFLFSYYCRGINYNDIVKLKEKNLKEAKTEDITILNYIQRQKQS
jgi:hypothetical protein